MQREIEEELRLDIPQDSLIKFAELTRSDSIVDFYTCELNLEVVRQFEKTDEVDAISFKSKGEISLLTTLSISFFKFINSIPF